MKPAKRMRFITKSHFFPRCFTFSELEKKNLPQSTDDRPRETSNDWRLAIRLLLSCSLPSHSVLRHATEMYADEYGVAVACT